MAGICRLRLSFQITTISLPNPRNRRHCAASSANFISLSAHEVNRGQNEPGRKVWLQYWESQITFHRSFLARLNYVHQNGVHHGIVRRASLYQWCSAGWFLRKARRHL
jgi:hypothetical protein